MVPISKSIWPLILFVYLNLHFILIIRFNLLCCFSKTFFQERSKASPPNFAPPFCALCLIVCDFLPKTWNLGRKEGKSALSGAPEGTPPVAYGDSPLGDGAFGIAAQFQAEVQSLPRRKRGAPSVCSRWSQPPSPRGRLNPLSHRCAMPAPPKGELLTLPQSFPPPLKPSPWGRWLDAKRQDGRGSPTCENGLAERPQTLR